MKKRSRDNGEIYPDEIFLDARNMPTFDTQQFEGRVERPIAKHALYLLFGCFVLVLLVIVGKLFALQIASGKSFFERSLVNTLRLSPVFPDRATIKDRNAVSLAWTEGTERKYIKQDGFSHLLGYLGHADAIATDLFTLQATTSVGIDGIEKNLNLQLAGTPGVKIAEADALGRIQSENVREEPVPGAPAILSIDARIQTELYTIIKSVATDRGFAGGAGILMDVTTGELIALTSYPEFSSQVFSDGKDRKAIATALSDKTKPFLDRAVSGLYAPGSIIKPFMALGALAEGVITPEKKILSTGKLELPNPYDPTKKSIFKDWRAHGWVAMRDAIGYSSDEYFYQIGGGYKDQKGIGITNIEKYAKLFGFGEKTGIVLDSEGIGNIPSPEWKAKTFPSDPTWRIGNTYHTVIGQYGFLVTPIQVARAVGGLATSGTLTQPTILKTDVPQVARQVALPRSDFKIIHEGMRMSAQTGTAKGLNLDYLSLAAKTGTAELGASKARVNSWVVGFFPYEQPRYAFVVVMESGPVHNTIGGVYVMRQLFDWMYWHTPEYIKAPTGSY